jgi:hypothetical protein
MESESADTELQHTKPIYPAHARSYSRIEDTNRSDEAGYRFPRTDGFQKQIQLNRIK